VDWVKKQIYGQVDAILIPAPSHVPDYARFGFHEENTFFGLNVVDNDYFFEHAQNSTQSMLDEKAIKLPSRYLLGVGRQVEKKNWFSLLTAWEEFCNRNPESDLSLVLVGNGPEHERLMNKASALQRVVFFDFVTPEELASIYYAHAEGVVLPSRYGETWGLTVNEGMATGLPALVSRQCGCCETLVHDGINGWSFDPDDTSEIVRCIEELDSLHGQKREKVRKASLDAIKDWGLPKFVQGVDQAVQYVMNKEHHKRSILNGVILKLWKGRYRPT